MFLPMTHKGISLKMRQAVRQHYSVLDFFGKVLVQVILFYGYFFHFALTNSATLQK